MAKSKLTLVKPALTEERRGELISDISAGTFTDKALEDKYGLSRQQIRTLRAKLNAPKITLPSRAKLNPITAAPRAVKPPPIPAAKPKPQIVQRLIGIGLLLVAFGFGTGNAIMNYRFGVSFGQDETSRLVLGGLTIAIDGGALLLFAAAGYLREDRRYGLCLLAFLTWLPCIGLSTGAALGFASSNIGDGLQSRDTVIQHRRALVGELSRAETERSKITEDRDPQAIEQQIQIEQGKVPEKNWKSSDHCNLVTFSGPFCLALNQERQRKISAEQRVALDVKIGKLSAEIAALPPVSAKDPPAEQIAQMAFGLVTAEQVRSYLVRCLAIIPGFASILLAIARTLLR